MQKDYLLNQEKQAEKAEKEIKSWGVYKAIQEQERFCDHCFKKKY